MNNAHRKKKKSPRLKRYFPINFAEIMCQLCQTK